MYVVCVICVRCVFVCACVVEVLLCGLLCVCVCVYVGGCDFMCV